MVLRWVKSLVGQYECNEDLPWHQDCLVSENFLTLTCIKPLANSPCVDVTGSRWIGVKKHTAPLFAGNLHNERGVLTIWWARLYRPAPYESAGIIGHSYMLLNTCLDRKGLSSFCSDLNANYIAINWGFIFGITRGFGAIECIIGREDLRPIKDYQRMIGGWW